MFKVNIDINKKDYFACSMFYIRKYISLRELILLVILTIAALLFWFTLENKLILIVLFVVLALIGLAVILFITTALAGYKTDFIKYNITSQHLIFAEWGFEVRSIDEKGNTAFTEKIEYQYVDKVAMRKDRIYIYGGVALPFYIFPESVIEGDYAELRLFLISHIDKSKFKMKSKVRAFPYYSKKKFDKDLEEKIDRSNKHNK